MGGSAGEGAQVRLHAANNLWEVVHGWALEIGSGASAWVENNMFIDVAIANYPRKNDVGKVYAVRTP